jgi:hypothetical protein
MEAVEVRAPRHASYEKIASSEVRGPVSNLDFGPATSDFGHRTSDDKYRYAAQ